jgi:DNA end-binding protein Ku
MEVLRKSLAKNAVVTSAGAGEPISLAERRARKASSRATDEKSTAAKRKRPAKRRTVRNRARRG